MTRKESTAQDLVGQSKTKVHFEANLLAATAARNNSRTSNKTLGKYGGTDHKAILSLNAYLQFAAAWKDSASDQPKGKYPHSMMDFLSPRTAKKNTKAPYKAL